MSEDSNNNLQQPQGENGQKKGRSNLAQRCLTAIFIAVLYVGPIMLRAFVHELFFDALVLALTLCASYEFSKAISVKFEKPAEIFVYVNVVLGYVLYKVTGIVTKNYVLTPYFVALLISFVACLTVAMFTKKYSVESAVTTLFAMIYPGLIMACMMHLNYLPGVAMTAILLAFIISTLTDTMAYFVGCSVKGPKLCPTISPKKTISGAIGGLLGGIGGGIIVYFLAQSNVLGTAPVAIGYVANLMHFIVLGLGGALFCQLGDLLSSYVKRAVGIKDYGKILKGHGGFMDRVDGLIVTSMFICIYLMILGIAL